MESENQRSYKSELKLNKSKTVYVNVVRLEKGKGCLVIIIPSLGFQFVRYISFSVTFLGTNLFGVEWRVSEYLILLQNPQKETLLWVNHETIVSTSHNRNKTQFTLFRLGLEENFQTAIVFRYFCN